MSTTTQKTTVNRIEITKGDNTVYIKQGSGIIVLARSDLGELINQLRN